MGRKIFAEKQFDISDKVVSYEAFIPFLDQGTNGFCVNPELIPSILKHAEALIGKEYPQLLATDFMMFARMGNRSVYQDKYFPRRADALALAVAEHVEGKGRFTDSLINLVWMILEETTWVLPAHTNEHRKPGRGEQSPVSLTYAFKEDVDYIDLFSATTAATMSWIYYLCKETFDRENPVINERILYELNRRIVKPFLNPAACIQMMWWTGMNGRKVNNWNPWIVSNILTVCAFAVKDYFTREAIVKSSMTMLDCFINVYHEDGGCDEGPSYWGAAGAALFDALQVLYDLTGGIVNIFKDPLIRRMGEYVVKVVVNGDRVLNFADSPAKVNPNPAILYQWGVASDSEMMRTFGQNRLDGELCSVKFAYEDASHPYRGCRIMTMKRLPKCEFVAPEKFWMDGIVIAGTRESSETDRGLYLAFKGGTNDESHNHNDIGNVVVFADGKPIFIDAGSGTYTKRTFNEERYTIWSMCSDYHNVATINHVTQVNGPQAYSCDHVYEEATGKLTMNLKHAYPEEAGIEAYTRSAVLENGAVIITDLITLKEPGDVMFSLICTAKPEQVTADSFILQGRTVTFDESLELACEALDSSWPETELIPGRWDVGVLYRIILQNKEPITEKKYQLVIK